MPSRTRGPYSDISRAKLVELRRLFCFLQTVAKANLRPYYAIAISGHGMKADREMSAEAGFCHHLVKPIFPEKLDALLQEATTELKKKE